MVLRLKEPSKYRNKRCVVDGYSFPSQVEGKRYEELRQLEKMRLIRNLKVQFRFDLHTTNSMSKVKTKVTTYVADFIYFDQQKFETVIEDVKGGDSTPMFKLKKKMVEAEYGYKIVEIRYGTRKRPRLKREPVRKRNKCLRAYSV